MSTILRGLQFGADDNQDMVILRLGASRPVMPYQNALEFVHKIRMGCKHAARADRAAATFVRDMESDLESLADHPRAHKGFRRSNLVGNVRFYEVRIKGVLIALVLDNEATIMHYEDGIKFHRMLHRAAHRAKGWVGDTSKQILMLGNLTNAEEDYRLGLS